MKKTTKLLSVILAAVVALSFTGLFALAGEEHVHNYQSTIVAPTCADKGYTLYVCADCGDSYKDNYVPENGHFWGNWRAVDEATCTSEGHEERICTVCTAKETKTLPITDHRDLNGDGQCDVCGEKLAKKEYIFNPYDWIKAFIEFLRNWFAGIFG